MSNYRKKDVISDIEIDAFENMEINRIKANIEPKSSIFKKLKWVVIVPALLLAAVFTINLFNGPEVNPLLEDIELVAFNSITLDDLPVSLQGNQSSPTTSVRNQEYSPLSYRFSVLHTLMGFEEEQDVTGEGQQQLQDIIEDDTFVKEAQEVFNNIYENIMFLKLDEVATIDNVLEYYFEIYEDGTYTLTLQVEENDELAVIEAKTFYREDELFYQGTMEVINDDARSIFKVVYNQDETEKYQYAKHNLNGVTEEAYVFIDQSDDYTTVVATHTVDTNTYEIVANANDLHGVIFISYTTNEESIAGTEYYNEEGALLKQEVGFDDLSEFNIHLNNLYTTFEENPDIQIKNLSDQIVDFNEPESFVIEIPFEDAALVAIQEVPVTLIVDDTTSYTIDYTYSDVLYTKKEADFTSGDTLYAITNNEVTDSSIRLTFSAIYKVPEIEVAPNGLEYYVVHKYMAKYIEAAEGFSIVEELSGNYKLVNNAIIGELGDRKDLDIEVQDYFVDGELTPTTVLQYTCDIQIENIVFTKLDTVEAARTNIASLYQELIPTEEELLENYQSIDVSMFE